MKEKDRVYWLGVTATFFAFTFAVILLLSSILGFYCLILFFGTLIVLSNRKIEKQKEVIKELKSVIRGLIKGGKKDGSK